MGIYLSKTKEEWVSDSLSILIHKFGNSKFTDVNSNPIEWNEIKYYLGILYENKYNKLNINKFMEENDYKFDPTDLDYYI
jgi:hypothetical protein